MYLVLITTFTLIAFAANSVLCRMALGGDLIDPVSFTSIRLISGAVVLTPLAAVWTEPRKTSDRGSSWTSALALFGYAVSFSLAYVSLEAGIGALILFGAVQATMIVWGLIQGERPRPLQWIGLSTAIGGLVYLVSPGITAPDPVGALLMLISGIAWGLYSVRGKNLPAPVSATHGNFIRSVPMAVAASVAGLAFVRIENTGLILALVSGAITSGLGYVLWYRTLRDLSTTKAAVVQLLVPVLTAFGGVMFLSEAITPRLIVASALILGGVAMAVIIRAPIKDGRITDAAD